MYCYLGTFMPPDQKALFTSPTVYFFLQYTTCLNLEGTCAQASKALYIPSFPFLPCDTRGCSQIHGADPLPKCPCVLPCQGNV